MNEQTPVENGTTPRPGGRLRKSLVFGAVFVAGLVAGGTAVTGAAAYALGFGGPGHGHGWRHDGEMNAEHVKERTRDRMAWVLGRVDATDEQEAKIGSLLDTAVDELAPIVASHRGNRGELVAALSGDTVDAERVEQLRARALADMEAGSRIVTDALVRSAEVLTAEQRATLVEAVRRHRH